MSITRFGAVTGKSKWKSDRRLYLDETGTKVLEEGDPGCRTLLVGKGGSLPIERVEALGLVEKKVIDYSPPKIDTERKIPAELLQNQKPAAESETKEEAKQEAAADQVRTAPVADPAMQPLRKPEEKKPQVPPQNRPGR